MGDFQLARICFSPMACAGFFSDETLCMIIAKGSQQYANFKGATAKPILIGFALRAVSGPSATNI